MGKDARAFGGAKVCAIGPATAQVLADRGIKADVVPPRFVAESVAETLIDEGVGKGSRVLVLRAAVARGTMINSLREQGAEVDVVAVYDTVMPDEADQVKRMRALLEEGLLDAVTFTSSSTVRNFCSMLFDDMGVDAFVKAMEGVACLSIGPITSQTMRDFGLAVTAEAAEYTIPGLVQVIGETFA